MFVYFIQPSLTITINPPQNTTDIAIYKYGQEHERKEKDEDKTLDD